MVGRPPSTADRGSGWAWLPGCPAARLPAGLTRPRGSARSSCWLSTESHPTLCMMPLCVDRCRCRASDSNRNLHALEACASARLGHRGMAGSKRRESNSRDRRRGAGTGSRTPSVSLEDSYAAVDTPPAGSGRPDTIRRPLTWQANALPLSYYRREARPGIEPRHIRVATECFSHSANAPQLSGKDSNLDLPVNGRRSCTLNDPRMVPIRGYDPRLEG